VVQLFFSSVFSAAFLEVLLLLPFLLMARSLRRILPMSESPAPESDENDPNQSHLLHVLQCSVLPDAVDLGRQKDSTRPLMTPDQLRQFAQKLPANTHVTSLRST
jgi:hypothetical protein